MSTARDVDSQLRDARRRLTEAETERDDSFAVYENMQTLARRIGWTSVLSLAILTVGLGTAIVDGLYVPQGTLTPLPELTLTVGLLGLFVTALGYVMIKVDESYVAARRKLARHDAVVRGTRQELDLLLELTGLRKNDE